MNKRELAGLTLGVVVSAPQSKWPIAGEDVESSTTQDVHFHFYVSAEVDLHGGETLYDQVFSETPGVSFDIPVDVDG